MSRPEAVHAVQIQVISVSVALQALETLLIDRGLLKDDELMSRVRDIAARAALGEAH